jgi:hypothetical protein
MPILQSHHRKASLHVFDLNRLATLSRSGRIWAPCPDVYDGRAVARRPGANSILSCSALVLCFRLHATLIIIFSQLWRQDAFCLSLSETKGIGVAAAAAENGQFRNEQVICTSHTEWALTMAFIVEAEWL